MKLTAQLGELKTIKQNLSQINPTVTSSQVVLGSLIYTNYGKFYLAASIGKVDMENQQFIAISMASPIGQLMLAKKKNEDFLLNGREYSISKVLWTPSWCTWASRSVPPAGTRLTERIAHQMNLYA